MTESSENTIFLPSLAIGGYRSFGDIQYFEEFSKINLFIGRNNCGKSNVLRAINEFFNKNKKADLKHLDYHLGGKSQNEVLLKIGSKIDVDGIYNQFFEDGCRNDFEDFLKELPTTTLSNNSDIYYLWRDYNGWKEGYDPDSFSEILQSNEKCYEKIAENKKIINCYAKLIRNRKKCLFYSLEQQFMQSELYGGEKSAYIEILEKYPNLWDILLNCNKCDKYDNLKTKTKTKTKIVRNKGYNNPLYCSVFPVDENAENIIKKLIPNINVSSIQYHDIFIKMYITVKHPDGDSLNKLLALNRFSKEDKPSYEDCVNDIDLIANDDLMKKINYYVSGVLEIDGLDNKELFYKFICKIEREINIPRIKNTNIVTIKATRKISANEPEEGFADGAGMIQEINQHKNPTANEVKREKVFSKIQDFLRDIIAKPDAEIQIPHDLKTINVRIDGKLLPLESLGSGIEEIIIIAAAATLHENQIICIEEPELHLNPLLQKKLIRYLSEKTNNQYFIATHSAALLDTPDAEIYHLELKDGQTIVQRATLSDKNREICADLGYHPSDFLQSNCVIWVEGPTDRLYVNWWLQKWWEKESELIEGVHYSIMFYGGRLLSHLEGDEDSIQDRISLFRINQRSVVVMDSDKSNENKEVNDTKKRVKDEFKESNKGFVWITKGREIENYLKESMVHDAIKMTQNLSVTVIDNAIQAIYVNPIPNFRSGKYKNLLSKVVISTDKNGKQKYTDASKIEVANYIIKNNEPDFSILDLEEKIKELYEFIEKSQPDTSLKS